MDLHKTTTTSRAYAYAKVGYNYIQKIAQIFQNCIIGVLSCKHLYREILSASFPPNNKETVESWWKTFKL